MDNEKFHDRGYKSLFSHPRMVEELIRSFVKEDFVPHIDFSSLTRSFNSFVTEEFKDRETDIIWRVNVQGSPVYFYLLIEFQSTVDRFMVLRLLSYLLLFYLELIKDEQVRKASHLPAVFPLLLYSGSDRWTAASTMQELISPSSPVPSMFIPSFSYYRVLEYDFSEESLKEMNNLVSHLFLIEQADRKKLAEVVSRAVEILRREVEPELQRTFGLWLRKLFRKRKIDISFDIETMTGREVKTMLEANLQKYEEELIAKSRMERDIEVARAMKELGVDRTVIMKATGLKEEELNKL